MQKHAAPKGLLKRGAEEAEGKKPYPPACSNAYRYRKVVELANAMPHYALLTVKQNHWSFTEGLFDRFEMGFFWHHWAWCWETPNRC
jgi:hypothetical protein